MQTILASLSAIGLNYVKLRLQMYVSFVCGLNIFIQAFWSLCISLLMTDVFISVEKDTCEIVIFNVDTVELRWLEHPWNHENMFETGVVRANEC